MLGPGPTVSSVEAHYLSQRAISIRRCLPRSTLTCARQLTNFLLTKHVFLGLLALHPAQRQPAKTRVVCMNQSELNMRYYNTVYYKVPHYAIVQCNLDM